MKLAELIRKGGLSRIATATYATIATLEPIKPPTVATVAVAAAQVALDPTAFDERVAIIMANGVPEEWAEGYAMLCTMPCPSVYAPERWQQIVDDGGLFLDQWGRQAGELGWQATDVFGANPDAPEQRYDNMGLVPLLNGRRVCAITADTAHLDCGNSIYQTFNRNTMSPLSVAVWTMEGRS